MTHFYTRRILWAFVAECLVLAVILLSLDRFPAWALKTAAAIAIALPLICYLPIAAKPAVYQSWWGVFTEFRLGLLDAARSLRHCFSMQMVTSLYRGILDMELAPKTVDAWFALILFPFKVYVMTALPLLHIWYSWEKFFALEPGRRTFREAAIAFSGHYALCLPILLIGALSQALFFRRGRATETLLVFLVGILMLYWPLR